MVGYVNNSARSIWSMTHKNTLLHRVKHTLRSHCTDKCLTLSFANDIVQHTRVNSAIRNVELCSRWIWFRKTGRAEPFTLLNQTSVADRGMFQFRLICPQDFAFRSVPRAFCTADTMIAHKNRYTFKAIASRDGDLQE